MAFQPPQIIGHRGAAEYAPENTRESILTAFDMGVKWVEVDVKLTKDGVPIIFHDDELDRTTDGAGLVANTLYEDIKTLDAGSWFGPSFAGAKILTLVEFLDILEEKGMSANLEIKPCPGREKETAEVVMDYLTRCWDEPDRILISSFSHVSLEVAMDMADYYPRGFLLDEVWPDNWQELAKHLDVSVVSFNGHTVTREDVEDAIDFGKPITAYTINDAQKARQLQGWGVDGFFTDAPDVLVGNLIRSVPNVAAKGPKP